MIGIIQYLILPYYPSTMTLLLLICSDYRYVDTVLFPILKWLPLDWQPEGCIDTVIFIVILLTPWYYSMILCDRLLLFIIVHLLILLLLVRQWALRTGYYYDVLIRIIRDVWPVDLIIITFATDLVIPLLLLLGLLLCYLMMTGDPILQFIDYCYCYW